jgi:cell division protein FtsW
MSGWARPVAPPARAGQRPGDADGDRSPAARRPSRDAQAGRVVHGPERDRHEPDYLLMVTIIALTALGILMIYSSSAANPAPGGTGNPFEGVVPVLFAAGIGIVAMLVLSRMDYRWLRLISVPAYLVALALLVLVLMGPIGPLRPVLSGGAARWLQVGPLTQMHPAELAKLALVIYLAHWLARRGNAVGGLLHGTLPFLAIAGPFIVLVAIEPDLGTTTVIALAAFTMFFVAGANLLHLLAAVPVGVVGLAIYIMGRSYQLTRITAFLDPWNTLDGYQTQQGLLSLAMGGIFGSGLGQSRQPGGLSLPNADNDFVFAMIGQELGLVGGVLVIGLFLFFAWRGVRIAMAAPDTYGALLALGLTAALTIQAFINIGVVVNLLPITGITLPFVSSGGTSLVVSFAAVGILLSISRESLPRGSWIDAHPRRSRRNGRPPLPGAGGPALARPAPR